MIKRLVIAVLLLGLVAGGIVGFNMFRDQAIKGYFANRPVPALPVDTVVAQAGPWVPSLEAIGTVFARQGIDLAVEAGGVIREIGFETNDRIEKDQMLVRIADEIEQADLAAAQASVLLAEQTFGRAKTLGARGITAASSTEEAEASLNSAQAQVRRIEAVLGQKVLRAPFSGEIGIPLVEAGQFVTPGTTVATLQDTDGLRVDFSLPEQNLQQISIGQPVAVTGEQGLTATGSITGIEPRIDPATRLVSVRAEIDNQGGALRPGQFVRVGVTLPARPEVIALPQTAVVSSLYGDYVYAVVPAEPAKAAQPKPEAAQGGEASAQPAPSLIAKQIFVETGSRRDDLVEVTRGIEAGARVVIAGQNRLSNGVPVALSGEGAASPASEPATDKTAAADAPADTPASDDSAADAGAATTTEAAQ